MYKTLLVFDSYELLNAVKNLHIWNKLSQFEITDIVYDGKTAYQMMRKIRYDLVITEIRITGIDGLQLLRYAKKEGLCSHIVLCSEFEDFNYARQGIILGAFDYFTVPFDETWFLSVFNRIKNENYEESAIELNCINTIISLFEKQDNSLYEYTANIFEEIYNNNTDILTLDKKARNICKSITDEIFNRYCWLDLYIVQQDIYSSEGINESNSQTYKKKYNDIICSLFKKFCRLYPNVNNDKIREIILYILNNPENSLKQKSIANKFYVNASYLSMVFAAQTEMRFVDYLTTVKLERAVWLLTETNMKITDIAEKLDYKDIGYFSLLFTAVFIRWHI